MSKELVRNGGFERGNTDFWELLDVTSIESLAAAKKYGSYGCKMISSGAGFGYLKGGDYIPVEPYGLYLLSVWIKNSVAKDIVVYAWEYDADHQSVAGRGFATINVGTDWTLIEDVYRTRKGVSYIRLRIGQILMDVGDYSYIDSISVKEIDLDHISAYEETLVDIEDLTTKDTYYGNAFFSGIWKSAEYHLYCTSLTGTSPTLDVTIQGYDPNTAQWKDVLVFQQLVAAGSEFKTVLSGLGWKQRVKYVLGGTTVTDCDFEVGVVYKR